MQEHIISVRYSMSAHQGLGVSVPTHLHLSNRRLHLKLENAHTISLKHTAGLDGRC